jgi:hypothetical protein
MSNFIIIDGNIDLLRQNARSMPPKKAFLVEKLLELQLPDEKALVFETRSGAPGIFFDERYLTSRYDPKAEADREIDRVIKANDGKIPKSLCLFGSTGGHLINAAFDAGCSEVHVLEPRIEVLAAVLGLHDFTAKIVAEELSFSVAVADIFFSPEYRVRMLPDVDIAVSPAYPKAFPGLLSELKERIQTLIRNADIISSTLMAKQVTWFDFAVDNFCNMMRATALQKLFDRFEKTPIIVVAAGPSLDKNVRYLKTFRDRIMIVAVGTALKKLEKHGVVPDLAVALESNDIRSQFEGVSFLPDIFLALDIETFPKLWELPCRGIFGYAGASKYTRWFMNLLNREKSNIPVGGSVATAAFSMALQLGGDPLILVGQDLAFADDGTLHAGGIGTMGEEDLDAKVVSSKDDAAKLSRAGVFLVDGYYGGKVMTKTNLRNYLLWYEQSMPVVVSAGKRAINCTEGGARIPGFEQAPLKDVLESLVPLEFDVKQKMADLHADSTVDLDSIRPILEDVLVKTRRLRHLSKKLRKSMAEAVGVIRAHGVKHAKAIRANKLAERLDLELVPLVADIDHLITPLCNAALLLTEKAYDYEGLNEQQQIRMNMQQTYTLHDGFVKGADHLIAKLEQLLAELDDKESF